MHENNLEKKYIFKDINYICKSTVLIIESLKRGFDVAQMPNGDVIVTEIKVINTQYKWDSTHRKMIKIG